MERALLKYSMSSERCLCESHFLATAFSLLVRLLLSTKPFGITLITFENWNLNQESWTVDLEVALVSFAFRSGQNCSDEQVG